MEKKKSRNPVSERSKRWLTLALLELMEEKPYEQITVIEIATRADLVRQTFYKNFSSKNDVLRQYLGFLFQEYIERYSQNIHWNIHKLSCGYFEFWTDHKDFLELLIRHNLTYLLTEQYKKFFEEIGHSIEANKIMNDKVDRNSPQYFYVLSFLAGALTSMLVDWAIDEGRCSCTAMADLVDNILGGTYFPLEQG